MQSDKSHNNCYTCLLNTETAYAMHTGQTNHLFFAVQLSSVAPMCVQVSMTTDSKNIWRGLDMVPINCDTALVLYLYNCTAKCVW